MLLVRCDILSAFARLGTAVRRRGACAAMLIAALLFSRRGGACNLQALLEQLGMPQH